MQSALVHFALIFNTQDNHFSALLLGLELKIVADKCVYYMYFKKYCMKYFALICCSLFMYLQSNAALDTTVVSSHTNTVIKTNPSVGSTTYPAWAVFPSATQSYRKVLMQLSFECAPGLKCGEWDYINNIIIGRTGGVNGLTQNHEIARYITPYGFYWTAAMNWKHSWVYDVTDFALLLHDSVEVIYRHSGYENNTDRGWRINVKFICVEGTPVAEPVKISKLWDGSFVYGKDTDPIEDHLTAINITADAQTGWARFKAMNTGHGSDSAWGCMEFCRKYREVLWDGNVVSKKDIWRADCGLNDVYPQAGTWIYNRGGWCPGSPVKYDDVDIQNVGGGTAHNINMDMEAYSGIAYHGNLYTTAYLIEYKTPTNAIDAAIENIIAPNPDVAFKRMNPICNDPVIVLRNNGSTPLTSATIEYGLSGGAMTTYQWTGNLGIMQNDTVKLTNPINWGSASGKFSVTVKNPNGQADAFEDDNTMMSDFIAPEVLPSKIIVHFQTNKDASENSYKIVNATTGKVHYEKNGFTNEKLYLDTISLTPGDCYYFYFSDEGASSSTTGVNKDGLEFWAFNPYEGKGTLRIRSSGGSVLKDVTGTNSGPWGTSGGDFGTSYSFYFTATFGVHTNTVSNPQAELQVYPNPVTDNLNITYWNNGSAGNIILTDVQGKILMTEKVETTAGTKVINAAALVPGMYYIKLVTDNGTVVKKVMKQ